MRTSTVLITIAAAAGLIGGLFAPPSLRGLMDRVAPIAAPVFAVALAALAVLASRMKRENVTPFEKRLRRVFLAERR